MEDIFSRIYENLVGRLQGPLTFRLILQPLMAMIFAVRDGRKDALQKQAPYFWAIFTRPDHRRELLRSGWKAVGKVFVLAIIIDIVYQVIVFRWVYPLESVVVALILAFIPYLLLRGPITRIWPGKR